jgi:methyl-accepting chemotaxis protein
MTDVNVAMMASGAATEEVNASTEEVKASVTIFTQETELSMRMTEEIQNRAQSIGKSSQQSFQNATQLSVEYSEKLQKSMEHARVVNNIGTMAGVISEVAEQINLLSLNASIEAARAGEQGKGFAVVAMEIGKLAKETSDAVSQIQNTISDVEGAFKDMADESHSMLEFVQKTVMPDYNSFIGVAEQYESDAIAIEGNAKKISEMAMAIQKIMDEVSMAIQNITESTQSTADNSSKIMDSMNEVSEVVNSVSEMSNKQALIATNLNDVVSSFKLD